MLIPQMSLSTFKKLNSCEIKELKSYAVTSDGELLFFAIIPPKNGGMTITDHVNTKAEYLGVSANTGGGKFVEEITELEVCHAGGE